MNPISEKKEPDVPVLQGGGALGAYQAGAFEALFASGRRTQWVAGVSIGAINAASIAARCATVPFFGATVPIFTRIFTSFFVKHLKTHENGETRFCP